MFTGNQGAQDLLAGLTHDVAQHCIELHVHLRQRFLKVLYAAGTVLGETRPLPDIRAQHTDLIGRPKCVFEQAVAH